MASSTTPATTSATQSEPQDSYRAVHPVAVLGFALGLLSFLAFAHPMFRWTIPLAAAICSGIALWQIAQAPTEWTGNRLAALGMLLGIGCWASSLAVTLGDEWKLRRYGRQFAERFVERLRRGQIEGAFWMTMPRNTGQMTDYAEQMKRMSEDLNQRYMTFYVEVYPVVEKLKSGEYQIEFDEVEAVGDDRDNDFALVIYKLHGPGKPPSYLLVISTTMHAPDGAGKVWYVSTTRADYSPHSHQPRPAAGHGHSH